MARIVPDRLIFTIWLSDVSVTQRESGSETSNSRSRGSFQPDESGLTSVWVPPAAIFTIRLPPESAM